MLQVPHQAPGRERRYLCRIYANLIKLYSWRFVSPVRSPDDQRQRGDSGEVGKQDPTRAVGRRNRAGAKSPLTFSRRTVKLLTERDQLVTEVSMLRARYPAASPFLRKAETLLTRFWARADWQAREDILRTARWLLDMTRLQPKPETLNMHRGKRRRPEHARRR